MTTPQVLADKLIDLASRLMNNYIVELGSYHGKGSIALAKKANVQVYSIDDFQEKHGWIGERYGPEDEEIYWQNLKEAGVQDKVIQIKLPIEEAVKMWNQNIGLLYWDLGIPDRFHSDFHDWSYFVVPNGVFIIKDTPDDDMTTFDTINNAIESGGWEKFDYWNGVSFLRRLA